MRPQPAIRSLKYALGLKNFGADVQIIHGYTQKTLTELYGFGDEYFEGFIRLDPKNLERDLKEIDDKCHFDLIHSQNAPDFLTVSAIRSIDDVPIIHDNQDAISLQKTPYLPDANVEKQVIDERIANEDCDARIHVTDELRTYVQKKYGSKVDLVFQNYMSESMIPLLSKEKLSNSDGNVHIVYQGTLSSLDGDHYFLWNIFQNIASRRVHIHIYDSHSNRDYQRLAETDEFIHYHGHLNPRELYNELTKYDYGWSGFNVAKNQAHIDVALPNKTFEYIACGLPVLSFPHEAQKKFIEKHGVGLICRDLDEMQEKLAEKELIARIRKTVFQKRFEFTVERNLHKIINLYHYLTSKALKRES